MTDRSDLAPPLVRGPAWLSDVLAGAGVAWCLLRDAPHAPADDTDLDVLAAYDGLAALENALADGGFARLVRPGRGSHRFFVRYDAETDTWPKVDIVTRLCFGPHQEICTDLAEGVLARRRERPRGMWTPAEGDAFWLLLLHAMLDKGFIQPRHRERLAVLADAAEANDPPAAILNNIGLARASATELLDAVRAARWSQLEALVPSLRAAMRRQRRPHAYLTAFGHRLARRAARAGAWPLSRGPMVAVRAPAGAASTRLLVDVAAALPVEARLIHIEPVARKTEPTSRALAKGLLRWVHWLRGHLGARGGRVVLFSAGYAGDMKPATRTKWVRQLVLGRRLPRPDALLVISDSTAPMDAAVEPVVLTATQREEDRRRQATAAVWNAYAARWHKRRRTPG